MKSKCLAIGIILLFVGVTIAPTINFNTVKASTDHDLVEVTTQACGIKGFGDTTVKLTREQYQNLEEYLVDFRARLNHTSTREDAVPIFKEAVVELDKYGLLPKGMSVERAQRLVTGQLLNGKMIRWSDKILSGSKRLSENDSNYNCLLMGIGAPINNCIFYGPVLGSILYLAYKNDKYIDSSKLWNILFISLMHTHFIPLKVFSFLGFGWKKEFGGWFEHPYAGVIFSIGLSGIKVWNKDKDCYGGIFSFEVNSSPYYYRYYIGAMGFTGINIGGLFFLGHALLVKMS